jgi:hypothetical protein
MAIGMEFRMKNGDVDCYDPISIPEGFRETETDYVLDNGYHEYTISKSKVESIRRYPLCDICGYELYDDGCHNWHNI